MITPNIRFYAKLERVVNPNRETTSPRYDITALSGFYEPMEQLKNPKGQIAMYLMSKLKEGANVPAMRLQAKNSLNFTGLKDYFINGKISGFGYGYPMAEKTYSAKNLQNPFYTYRNDGFLFIVHCDEHTTGKAITPTAIELIVLEDAKVLISSYCKQLIMGGFNEAIKLLREQAKPIFDYSL